MQAQPAWLHPCAGAEDSGEKKIPETDAIFEQLHRVRAEVGESCNQLLMSLDAKATVKIGEFCRNGTSRVRVQGLDHDYEPEAKVTPFGLLLPEHDELSVVVSTSKVTSDFIVDTLESWWVHNRERFPEVDTLVLLQDNGPENNGHRTQYLNRMVQFVQEHRVNVRLAYYPPYHSKYNPVERCWGILEEHWNCALLDSVDAVMGFAKTMTWKQRHPTVQLVSKLYKSGVSLSFLVH